VNRVVAQILVSSAIALSATPAVAADHAQDCVPPEKPGTDGFCYPAIDLQGPLTEIFTVSGCQWLSGLTCDIRYNGKRPLPSEVFFTEFDGAGRQLGKHTRLVYPQLEAGQTGRATFRIRSDHPSRITLAGVWNGPTKNPY